MQVKSNCDFSHHYDFRSLLTKSALLGFCLFLNSGAIFTLLTLSFKPKHWPYLFSIYNLLCLFYELLRKTQDGREKLYHQKTVNVSRRVGENVLSRFLLGWLTAQLPIDLWLSTCGSGPLWQISISINIYIMNHNNSIIAGVLWWGHHNMQDCIKGPQS